ncbi:PREDICTED: sorting nexin-4-like, partial [Apaloderma vittatum]|uniref:sorting nexin-4-like n=1 Tax=Apaloderma vittatum TaxID=57397 RepID=UPI0005219181
MRVIVGFEHLMCRERLRDAFVQTLKETARGTSAVCVSTWWGRAVESQSEGQCAPVDSLWRRYSEFELLRNYLSVTYPHIVVPPLPEKRADFVWHKLSADNMDPDFVERRRIGLENFLLRVASHPVLCQDKIFYSFLTQEGGWKEMVNETGFQLKVIT